MVPSLFFQQGFGIYKTIFEGITLLIGLGLFLGLSVCAVRKEGDPGLLRVWGLGLSFGFQGFLSRSLAWQVCYSQSLTLHATYSLHCTSFLGFPF